MTWTNKDSIALDALIDRAEREGLWLWCHYQDLWFSPKRLREENAKGRFVWGQANWQLRPHSERISNADDAVRQAQAELDRVRSEESA